MSFGYSVSDAALLVQLAWKTVQNFRRAFGEHVELTREVSSLHVVIQSLEKEASKAGITDLAGAFTAHVDGFECIQLGRKFGHYYGKCLLRLDIMKVRMTH